MKTFSIRDAEDRLPELVDRAISGEDVLISGQDGSSVRMVPESSAAPLDRLRGVWAGRVGLAEDFDTLAPEELDLFESE